MRGAYPRDVTAFRHSLAALLGAARGGVSVVAFLVVIGALVWLLAPCPELVSILIKRGPLSLLAFS